MAATCPLITTLVATQGGRSALLTTPNCSTTSLELEQQTPDGSLVLSAQGLGVDAYMHAANFPAAVVYE